MFLIFIGFCSFQSASEKNNGKATMKIEYREDNPADSFYIHKVKVSEISPGDHSPLATSQWPKFQGSSLQNTGRSSYVGPNSNSVKWVFNTGDDTERCMSVGPDGVIYAGNYSNLYAISPDDGSVKWIANVPWPIAGAYTPPAISSDGYLYVGTGFDDMFKINASNGEPANINWPLNFSSYFTQGI